LQTYSEEKIVSLAQTFGDVNKAGTDRLLSNRNAISYERPAMIDKKCGLSSSKVRRQSLYPNVAGQIDSRKPRCSAFTIHCGVLRFLQTSKRMDG
jgi:hypothetical protein